MTVSPPASFPDFPVPRLSQSPFLTHWTALACLLQFALRPPLLVTILLASCIQRAVQVGRASTARRPLPPPASFPDFPVPRLSQSPFLTHWTALACLLQSVKDLLQPGNFALRPPLLVTILLASCIQRAVQVGRASTSGPAALAVPFSDPLDCTGLPTTERQGPRGGRIVGTRIR
jgi:hypothetical protein